MEKINTSYYTVNFFTHTYDAMCSNHSFWIVFLGSKNVSHVYISHLVFYTLTYASKFQFLFGLVLFAFKMVNVYSNWIFFDEIYWLKNINYKMNKQKPISLNWRTNYLLWNCDKSILILLWDFLLQFQFEFEFPISFRLIQISSSYVNYEQNAYDKLFTY